MITYLQRVHFQMTGRYDALSTQAYQVCDLQLLNQSFMLWLNPQVSATIHSQAWYPRNPVRKPFICRFQDAWLVDRDPWGGVELEACDKHWRKTHNGPTTICRSLYLSPSENGHEKHQMLAQQADIYLVSAILPCLWVCIYAVLCKKLCTLEFYG